MKLSTTMYAAVLSAALALPLAAAPADAHQQVASQLSQQAGKFRTTLKASEKQVVAGKKVVLSGQVKPATKGATVIIEKRIGDKKKWAEEARVKMGASGRFDYVDKPNTPGPRKYRAVVPAVGKHKKGVSDAVAVTVFHWLDLTKVPARSRNATYAQPSANINAVKYAPVYVGTSYYTAGSVDWNFNRECLTLRARYGNSDDSDDLATANISVVADGESIYSKSFGLTQSEPRTLDVSGAFRVGFQWTSTNPEGTPEDQSGAVATMAEPQVLCSF